MKCCCPQKTMFHNWCPIHAEWEKRGLTTIEPCPCASFSEIGVIILILHVRKQVYRGQGACLKSCNYSNWSCNSNSNLSDFKIYALSTTLPPISYIESKFWPHQFSCAVTPFCLLTSQRHPSALIPTFSWFVCLLLASHPHVRPTHGHTLEPSFNITFNLFLPHLSGIITTPDQPLPFAFSVLSSLKETITG